MFFAAGDGFAADVGFVFGGVAADEDFVGVTEVAGFGYEFVDVGVFYGGEFLVIFFG